MIKYRDEYDRGSSPDSAWEMWEGQVRKGLPYGFARYVNYNKELFIGFLNGTSFCIKGNGMLFNNFVMKYSGFYELDVTFRSKPSNDRYYSEFRNVSYEGEK